jgi:CobQ/CobB/MinD/ParA nucleotide binding domain
MSTVHLVGGEKGGVGKSVLARVLAQFLVDRDFKFVAVDADRSHGALLRTYSEFTQPADLEVFASADQIMDRALGSDRRVLVDLPAQSARALRRWMDAGGVVPFAREMDVKLVFWHVSDGGFDSVSELARVQETFEDSVRYVVVRNFGRSTDFAQLDESDALRAVLGRGGRVIDLPPLDSATMYKIDRMGASFWSAVHAQEGEFALTPMERRRAELWLNRAYQGLDGLEGVI